MASLSDFGIASISTALTKRFKLRKMVEVPEPVLDEAGLFEQNATYGVEFGIEAEGSGDLPADFAVATDGPTTIAGISGGTTVINQVGESQAIGRHNEWTASGQNAPATV